LSHQWYDFFIALVCLVELPHTEQVSSGKTTYACLRLRNIGGESFDDPVSPFCRLNLAADGCADLPVEIDQLGNYSFGNILEIARQRPDATRVAGMYAWNQLGRKVKKGERGIRILAPIVGVKRKKDEEAEKDITKQNTRVLVGFRNAYVFDVSQTEGAELPAMREMSGEVGENRARLIAFINKQNIELVFTENIAPALGMSYGGKIAILPGQSEAEEFSTLVHELAHEMLEHAKRRTTTTKVVRETEAESIAFVVGKAVGLNTGTASADYIHLYHDNASLLAESLEVIQQTSAVILAALQPSGIETMPDAELAQVA
jgi:hypothetical protein